MRNNKLGSALVSALFIMTLVAIAATAMSSRLRLDIYRTSTNLNSDKLYLASQAVTWWAMDELSVKNATFTALNEAGQVREFPEKFQHLYPGILTQGALFDLQAKINLNSLQNKKLQAIFYRLLEGMPDIISSSQRKLIFGATTHWISAYQPARGHDQFSSAYLKQTPPYYPGYQSMRNVSEFRLVQGVTANIYKALLPNITALPEITPININTAPEAVLMCLGNGLSKSQVKELLLARGEEGGITLRNIALLLKALNIPNEQVTIESRYFLSVSTASTPDSHLTVYTVIKRTQSRRGEAVVSIVNESLNTW